MISVLSSRRFLGFAFAAATLLATPSLAHAASPPLSQSLTGDAKAAYDSGRLLLDDHDYRGASTKFRAAYDASKDPRLLWNLAVCEKELRHYARASVLVDKFVHDAAADIDADQLARANATLAALKEFFSNVTLAVQPDNAAVSIDGEMVGRSPLASPVAVDIGTHTVHVERDGFLPVDQTIEVKGQTPLSISVSLSEAPTVAVLAIHPSDAADTVSIDNRVVGSGQWQGTLAAGPHRIKVTASGKQPYIAEITLAAGDHRSVDVTLENEKKSFLPWLIGGGVVVVAGGVVGGYFLFKPSDTTAPFPSSKLDTVHVSALHVGHR